MKTKHIPFYILIISIVLGAAIVALTVAAGPAPQCEGGMTPEADGCIIGADIGSGLAVLLGIGVYIFGAFMAFLLYAIRTVRHRTSPWQAAGKIVLVAIIGAAISFGAIDLLISNLPRSSA